MQLIRLETLDDERLDAYARLTDLQLRSRIEPARAMFIAETVEVIGRVLDGGAEPLSLLTVEEYLGQNAQVIARMESIDPEIPIFVLPERELEGLTGFHLSRGSLAAFRRPPLRPASEVLAGARLVVVLEDIVNHTNVGAIFRSAAAMGVDAVLVTPACYDPLYRRALRVSMGAVFQVPWARIGDDPHDWSATGIPLLHDLGFEVAAMALEDDSIPLDAPELKSAGKLALVLGTEGYGLSPATIGRCDHVVRIPMAHGVDSLNVAAASAVAFWELRRR